jgi:hypothetical protein
MLMPKPYQDVTTSQALTSQVSPNKNCPIARLVATGFVVVFCDILPHPSLHQQLLGLEPHSPGTVAGKPTM